jgi:3-keto-5-aminohexanoate cleavage enzyme
MLNFYKPEKLPSLMVAPNGARPMKKDHPKVPVTIPEIVETGKACFENGAEAIHFHSRNNNGEHVLDSGLCKETLTELQKKVPKMHLQITTEAIGKYSPEEMRKLAYEVMPPGISIGIREMIPSRKPENEDIKIYQKLIEAGTKVQHICYEPEDIDLLSNLLAKSQISKT